MTKGTCKSITTLTENRLNSPTKRHRQDEWIQKQDLYICCLQETHPRPKGTYRSKVRRWKKIFHKEEKERKKQKQKYLLNISIQVEIFISDKTDFKMKTVTADKDNTQ